MTSPVIELEGVEKRFGKHAVLRDFHMRVPAGELTGFVGPNGSGKTTCLRMITGLTHRSGGRASILGMDPSKSGVAIRRRCSYLPGETSLYPEMTGRQALQFGLAGYADRNQARESDMLARFDLPLARRVRDYSAGMKQKLAICVALSPDVDLYLLDEPDRNLDAAAQVYVRDIARKLVESGRSVLYCSHDLRGVESISKTLVFLRNGRSLKQESVAAARAALRHELRVLVKPGTDLPDGTEEIHTEPDGYLRVRTLDDPLDWVARIRADCIVSVEFGATRLDLLYRGLAARDDS